MKLYHLEWGLYPRRVLIYMAEKGISAGVELIPIDIMAGEHKQPDHLQRNPAGTVPVLETASGTFIRQSASIMEYLEEHYPSPNMLGETAEQRARTRDLVILANEIYLHLSRYWQNASPVWAAMGPQSPEAANQGYQAYLAAVDVMEKLIGDNAFLAGDHVTMADCIMFASAQFANLLYKEQLPASAPKLCAWYDRFAQRPSAVAPTSYPEMLLQHAAPIKTAA